MSEKVSFKLDGYDISVLDGLYVSEGKPTVAAQAFAGQLIGLLGHMRECAADAYLDLYNDIWREDEADPKLSREAFMTRLIDPKIVLYDEAGAACVYFSDSDMFAGHSIEVSIDVGKIARAALVG